MKKEIELLSPGGDVDAIKAAISAGADAIYCGLDKFNARAKATNISFDNLQGILNLAHTNSCQVFLTLNIIVIESEIPALFKLLNKLINTSIDGVIVQDLGMFYILSKYFKELKIHASTQVTTHNQGQILFLNKLKATRVNLSRELNINEITHLTKISHSKNILTEVFVHGSYCISFSGVCYISSVHGGNSGNRCRCSQPCRDKYKPTEINSEYPLNLKDNSAYLNLSELANTGVDSLKIEGRIKKFDYVYTVVSEWKKQLNNYYNGNKLSIDNSVLHKVFNRDFTNSFLKGKISKEMFINNPRDNSIKHLADINNYTINDTRAQDQAILFDDKRELLSIAKNKIKNLSIAKVPLKIKVSGKSGLPLVIEVQTSETSFIVTSKSTLSITNSQALDYDTLYTKFKAFNDTEYYIEKFDVNNLSNGIIIPFKELTLIKKQILFILNGSKEFIEPINVPIIKDYGKNNNKSTLSILISSFSDVEIYNNIDANIYFQLPSNFTDRYDEYVNIFTKNSSLIPWFTSILIGEDYDTSIKFIDKIKPKLIVANNIGVAYYAYKKGIPWVAGPHINTTNSYSLISLKENFNCTGAFVSNELNKNQIRGIKTPDKFKLYYSIYHPIMLMTSRVCLFYKTIGCDKHIVDNTCIKQCSKITSITNKKSNSFIIEKTKGNYHHVYNNDNYMNINIVADFPNMFSSFFIDLRDVKTSTKVSIDKLALIELFSNYINGNLSSINKLKQAIAPTISTQYIKGI